MVESDSEKRRKITRACDICRRKKIKCDGPVKVEEGLKCSNCENNNFTCTYLEAAKRKGPPKGYIESLENRNQRLEMLFRKMMPGFDYNCQVGPQIDRDTFETGCEADTSRWNKSKKELPPLDTAFQPTQDLDDETDDELEERMQQISMSAQYKDNTRYIGKSSSVYLMAALDEYRPNDEQSSTADLMEQDRRPEFWKDMEWSMEEENDPSLQPYSADDLPPPDLLNHLVNIFFDRFNIYFPILHRASFEADLHTRKHEVKFGGIVFLLCAAAARYSDDPRVVPPNDKDELGNVRNWRFAGTEFFMKFKTQCRRFLLTAATLEDLQLIILMIVYLQGGPFSPACWAIASVGLILAQDVGFHRKRPYGNPLQNEMRKRAFWCLYILDKQLSAMLGRPCTLNDENFDVDMPSVLPDEVETPMQLSISHFNNLIKLVAILGEVLRTIYVVNKRKRPNSANIPEPKRTLMDVAALDSKLHKWLDGIPHELNWDPSCKDNLTFTFMCMLQTTYYVVQIYIHRPFISTPKKPSPLGYPSLSICTNAARSCIHVLSNLQQRNSQVKYMDSWVGMGSFTSSVILIVSACEGRKNSFDPSASIPEMKEIHMGIKVVRGLEDRHLHAGRAHDILCKLVSRIDKIPTEEASNLTSPATSNFSASSSDSPLFPHLRTNVENNLNTQRRKIAKKPNHQAQATQLCANLANLPICTNDLANHKFYSTPTVNANALTGMETVLPGAGFDFNPTPALAQPPAQYQAPVPPQPQFVQPGIGLKNEYNLLGMNNPLGDYNMLNGSTYPDIFTAPQSTEDMNPSAQDPVQQQQQQDLWSLLPNSTYNPDSEDWAKFFKYTQ